LKSNGSHVPSIDEVAAREKEFFAGYYGEGTIHPKVKRMRLGRDIGAIREQCLTAETARVLSVGCGAGELERLLAPHVGHILAVDLSPVAIERAKRELSQTSIENIEFRCADALKLAESEPFDLVVCAAFLHHVPASHLAAFLTTITKSLAPGGWLYSQDPNVGGLARRVGRFVLGRRYHRYHSPDERELDPRELEQHLHSIGMAATRTRGLDVLLIPLSYMLPRAPAWFFAPVLWFDRMWCATGLHRWASGFYMASQKPR